MRHSVLNKRKAFAFISDEIAAGRQPTDSQLMDLCGFYAEEHVKTLLADLSDEGGISIAWDGSRRTISLGPREKANLAPAPRPVPSVKKPKPSAPVFDEDAAAGRLLSIVRRPEQPTRTVVSQPQVAPHPEPISKPVCQPEPLQPEGRRQLSFSVPGEMYLAIAAQADETGDSVAAIARRIFGEAFDAKRCDTRRKHKVRAQIARTCEEDGFELPAFVTMLIERGFASYMVDRAAECAEAAE